VISTDIRIAILAALFIIGALILPVTALNDNEKSALEAISTSTLMKSDSSIYGLVEIDYGNTMKMWFMGSVPNFL
jgi:hypothetical protein